MEIREIAGGVCAPAGFTASGIHAGVRAGSAPEKRDLMLLRSEVRCNACGLFTQNQVKAAPVLLSRARLKSGYAQAIIANSGNANACCDESAENAERMARAAAQALQIAPDAVLVASTGVIGQRLNIEAVEAAVPALAGALRRDGSDDAAHAIMTTDTVKKEEAVAFSLDGKPIRIGGIAKGSGMIHPNMGTMLCFLTTDCAISREMLRAALKEAVRVSFNRISVDGDTSTNDTCILLANALAGNAEITAPGEALDRFTAALTKLCITLARKMARDGEGAQHLITCTVSGARDESAAERMAKSVIGSSLTKAAVFGGDANWGRVLCAMGYSGETFDCEAVDIAFRSDGGTVEVCRSGRGLPFDEDLAKKILSAEEVNIDITLHGGDGRCTCWGCDLTYDYVRINGDYRT